MYTRVPLGDIIAISKGMNSFRCLSGACIIESPLQVHTYCPLWKKRVEILCRMLDS